MQWKRRKENSGFGGERENSNAYGGRRVGKWDNYRFTSRRELHIYNP
jgi:hypothetical protein